jgi:hypothetical protein
VIVVVVVVVVAAATAVKLGLVYNVLTAISMQACIFKHTIFKPSCVN